MTVASDSVWDLLVDNRDGQLTLVVEVKRKTNVSPEWAASLRRNIFAHGTFPKAPYFIMAFPDKFYLWSNTDTNLDQAEPTYIIDARPILQPYFERAGITANQISEQSLELIIASWLGEVIYPQELPENVDASHRWLVDSGLATALAGGKLKPQVVA